MTTNKELEEIKKQQINSPENRWYAGERVGHPPSEEDCRRQYNEFGGFRALMFAYYGRPLITDGTGEEPAHTFFKHPPPDNGGGVLFIIYD